MAIEIVSFPINSMVIFHGYVSHNQMVGWMDLPFLIHFTPQIMD